MIAFDSFFPNSNRRLPLSDPRVPHPLGSGDQCFDALPRNDHTTGVPVWREKVSHGLTVG
jgi:hypothetical protein